MNATPTSGAALLVRVNGAEREVPAGSTLADLVAALGLDPRTVAIERNGEIAPRARWSEQRLAPDDRLELVRFVQGG